MKKILIILCLFAVMTGGLFAHTSGIVEKTCPLCAHEFDAVVDMSGTQFGLRLDLKPLGAIAAPWRLPVCPQCHFVLYTEEISDQNREILRKFVASAQCIDAVAQKHSSYFLLARILKELKADPFTIANAYLKASWQVEEEPARLAEYLNACLVELKQYVETKPEQKDDYLTSQVLIGEILRRTSRFDDARAHFEGLRSQAAFKVQPYRTLCEYQLELIRKRDASPQDMPEITMTEEDIRQTPPFVMLEKSPLLSLFTKHFSVSDLRADEGSTHGVYFFGDKEWSGSFTPKTALSCPAEAKLIFRVDSNGVISVGLTATQVLESLAEVCDTPFVQKLLNGKKPGRVRLRAAGDRLHWNTEEVEKYRSILQASGIEPAPVKQWMKIILDVPEREMISLYHPRGEDLFIVDYGLLNNPSWRDQYQKLTGKSLSSFDLFLDDQHCPITDRNGKLRLIEIKRDLKNDIEPAK